MATITSSPTTELPATAAGRRLGRRSSRHLSVVVVFLILTCGAMTQLAPLAYMVSTSLKDSRGIFELPIRWIPDPIVWRNYVEVWSKIELWRGFANSLLVAVTTTVAEVFVSAAAGYAFARMRFPGRNTLFIMLLITMMIPGVVTLIPSFVLFRYLEWIDTFKPLIVPLFFGTAFATFLSRQFFLTLPRELEDAAKVDGASPLQTFWYIFLPLAGPILATLGGLGFIARWNDYLGPLIYINSQEKYTVPLMLAQLNGLYEREWNLLMAGSVIALLPIVVILLVMQKYFVESVATTGLKG
ncbi:MAG: carbohydrate ABC transporter permease [Chloroflexi bacterium]|nr:carbohydrate ABC transporter permease [Chloroflexota bacterium]MCI0574943.1 carbohydrate ABC transporter permease [Chloroflexota bacterium]MCI0645853.1 carbohydrate ABC transporter permease [Chloroflexota bacterium]MCI0725708.1 carbohydrate ABC transporter permease [Chloroflexota bacterium]